VNREELTKFFEFKTNQMVETMKKKNADYAGSSGESAFSNFQHVEGLGIATTEQGFLTRMTDKLCRISNLTKAETQVKDESIQDTLLDLANYSLLLAAYLEWKSGPDRKPEK